MNIFYADADYSDETSAAGWYAFDGEYHGPFLTQDEARAFVEYCDAEDAIERRHIRSLRHAS